MIGRFRPDYMAFAMDGPRDQLLRREMFAPYKANRKKTQPVDLEQIQRCERVAAASGIPPIYIPRWEADDVLATLAHLCAGPKCEVIIATLDKDLGQCVRGDRVLLWDGKDLHYECDIEKRWKVKPELVTHVQALAGDSSDNLPGAKGIGLKLATAYIKRFGSVEATVANRDKLTPAKRKALEGWDWQLHLDLVTMRTDLPLPVSVSDLAYDGMDMDAIHEISR